MVPLLFGLAHAAEPTPVHWDCYLPEARADCADLAERLFSGAFRSSDGEGAVTVNLRARNRVDGNQEWDHYTLEVLSPDGSTQHVEFEIHTAIDWDLANQRVYDRMLATLATTGELTSVVVDDDGTIAVTWSQGAAEAEEEEAERKVSPWYFAPNVSGSLSYASTSTDISGGGGFTLNYSDPLWRFKLHGSGYYSYQSVNYGSIHDVYTSTSLNASSTVVRTLKKRWSMALQPGIQRATGASNLELATTTSLGVEYNLVPFQTGTNNGNFVLQYRVGLEYDRFSTANILGDKTALFPWHDLSLSVGWHFQAVDIDASVSGSMNMARPEFSSVFGYLGTTLRLTPTISVSPWVYASFQNAQISQPQSVDQGTLDELRAAGMWSQFGVDGGLSFGFVLGNAQLYQNDQRWE